MKEIIKKEDNLLSGRLCLQAIYLIRGYYSKYVKNLYNLAPKTNNLIKKWAGEVNRHFPKKPYRWPTGIIHEMVLNVTIYQGNANQNHSKVSPHTYENGS